MSTEDRIFNGEENIFAQADNTSGLRDFVPVSDNDDGAAVEMAQANEPASERGDRVPESPETTPQPFPREVIPDTNNVAVLPENATVEEIRVVGDDLILVQADGSEIIIPGAADNIPTFLIGDIQVPQQVLLAVLEQSGVNVAAGPDGSLAVVGAGPGSSGGDFDDGLAEVNPEGLSTLDLLGNTDLAFGAPGGVQDLGAGPLTFDNSIGSLFENAVNNAFDPQEVSGQFLFRNGFIKEISLATSFNMDEDAGVAPVTGSAPTSGGTVVGVDSSQDGNILTLTGMAGDTLVFTLVTNVLTGEFTFTQFAAFDHPDTGQTDVEDILRLQFNYIVTNGATNVSGELFIDIGDDAPTLPGAVASTVEDEALDGGNDESDGLSASVSNVSLNIDWGADNANPTAGGGDHDRSVEFTSADVAVSGDYGSELTSGGQTVRFVLLDGGTIVGYIGESVPTLTTSDGVVFYATLSDADAGSYSFTLVQPLDHTADNAENSLSLTFNFTATDSDGDSVSGGTFTVAVVDDVPVVGNPKNSQVDEDGLLSGNVGESYPDNAGDYQTGKSRDGATVSSGSLNISWGADNTDNGADTDDGANQLFQDTPDGLGDRSVTFATDESGTASVNVTNSGNPVDLTSGGQTVYFALNAAGTVLVGYLGTEGTSFDAIDDDDLVFRVSLSDDGSGSYSFELLGTLDHTIDNKEDNIRLSFEFDATDSDGDTVSSSFDVVVDDDAPISNDETSSTTIDEDDLANYTPIAHALGWPVEGSNGTSPFEGNTTWYGAAFSTGDLSTVVNFGADGPAEDGGFAFSFANDAAASEAVEALGLKSKGDDLTEARIFGEWILVGTEDRVVFAVHLESDGSYKVVLVDQLDHAATDDPSTPDIDESSEIALDLSSWFTATDGDGDTITLDDGSVVVTVIDDVPVVVGCEHGTADEDDLFNYNIAYPVLFDFWQGSVGTSPYDGTGPDNSHTGLFGTVPVWGTLADNIVGGADEKGTFSLVSEEDATDLIGTLTPDGVVLKSHGDEITYVQSVTIDGIGDVMGFFASDGRLVFGLFVSENGTYNFRLFDQIDHIEGSDYDDSMPLDFSEFVQFTDFDGDVINLVNGDDEGIFVITVVDDAPIAHDVLTVSLDEDDLGAYAFLNDDFKQLLQLLGIGSQGTDQDPTGFADKILGTTSQQGLLNEIIGDNTVIGGADEFGSFGFVDQDTAEQLLAESGWTSKGDAIDCVKMVELPEIGQAMGFYSEDGRLIISIAVGSGPFGSYDIRVWDQVDHYDSDGNPVDSLTLDLGDFVTYTDYDGDTITLDDHVNLTIVDDIPELSGATVVGTVEEEEGGAIPGIGSFLQGVIDALGDMDHGNEDTDDVNGLDLDDADFTKTGNYTSGSLSSLVVAGADERGTFSFDSSIDGTTVRDTSGNVVTSKGQTVLYQVISLAGYDFPVLVGYVNVAGDGYTIGVDRLVFAVVLSDVDPMDLGGTNLIDAVTNDKFVFIQLDQLDHHSTDNADNVEDVLSLDIGAAIDYTDADGDTISLDGKFVIQSIDDVPVQVEGQQVVGVVEEEHLAQGNEDFDDVGGLDGDTPADPGQEVPNPAYAAHLDLEPIWESDTKLFGNVTGSYYHLAGNPGQHFWVPFSGGFATLHGIWEGLTPPATVLQGASPANYDVTTLAATGDLSSLVSVGADEDGKFSLNRDTSGLPTDLTVGGEAVSYAVVGDTLVAYIAGEPAQWVFTLEVQSDGTYTFTLYSQIDHHAVNAADNAEGILDLDLSAAINVSDADGDTITLGDAAFIIKVIDDKPEFSGTVVTAELDEDDIDNVYSEGNHPNDGTGDGSTSDWSFLGWGDAATTRGSAADAVKFGADGALAGAGFSFSDNALEVMTDLGLSSKGVTLSYTFHDGVLIAYANTGLGGSEFNPYLGDRPVFSLELDPVSGEFVYRQYDQLDHEAGNGENIELLTSGDTIAGINFGAIIVATDGDGDSTVLDGQIIVEVTDDVPEIGIWLDKATTVDESGGGADDNITGNKNWYHQLFASIDDKGWDPDMGTVYARDDVVDYSIDGGADDTGLFAGSVNRSLELRIDDPDSGLKTTDGDSIYLCKEGDFVVGRTTSGEAAFAIHIDSHGVVTIAQYLSLKHPFTHDADEAVNLDGKISAVLTVEDYDHDEVTQAISIGARIRFEDDGPSVGSNHTVTIEDDDLANGIEGGSGDDYAPRYTSGVLSHDFGADGEGGTVSWLNGETTTSGGAPGVFSYNADTDGNLVITQGTTDVILVKLNASTGEYEVIQLAPITHAAGNAENNQYFNLTYLVSDGDGDTAKGHITIKVDDDTPVLTQALRYNGVYESGIGTASATDTATFNVDYGSDGYGSTAFTGQIKLDIGPGLAGNIALDIGAGIVSSDKLTSDGKTIIFELADGNNTLLGYVMADDGVTKIDIIKITLTNNDSTATTTLYGPIDHLAAADDTPIERILIDATVVFTDGDNDPVTGIIRTTVHDDTPVLSQALRYNDVYESGIGAASATDTATFNVDYGSDGYGSTAFTGQIKLDIGPGLAGNVVLDIGADIVSSDKLTLDGKTIIFELADGNNTLLGYVMADDGVTKIDIIKITLTNNDSTATTTLYGPIDHLAAADDTPIESIRIDATVVFTDGDNDPVTGIIRTTVHDDTPSAIGQPLALTIDEDDIATAFASGTSPDDGYADGSSTGGTTSSTGPADLTGDLAPLVDFGADGGSFRFVSDVVATANGQVKSGKEWVVFTLNGAGTELTGTANGHDVMKIILAADGKFTVQLFDALDHPAGDGENTIFKTLGSLFEAVDGDGDAIRLTNQVSISFTDDVPVAVADSGFSVSENTTTSTVFDSLLDNDTQGADGAKLHAVELPDGDTHYISANGSSFPVDGVGTYVFNLDGTWAFTPASNYTGAADFKYQLIDGDGDESDWADVELAVNGVVDPGQAYKIADNDTSVSTNKGNISGISGYELITDFDPGVDKLHMPIDVIVFNDSTLNDSNGGKGVSGLKIREYDVSNGLVSFFSDDKGVHHVTIDNWEKVALAFDYLEGFDLGAAGTTAFFTAQIDSVTYTFVYQQSGEAKGTSAGSTFIAIQGVTLENLNSLVDGNAIDPIILDLDHNGFAFSSVDNGVTFDIDGDGSKDQVAWTSDDGILAYDLDGNGVIDNGTELFTPTFNGGSFASGIEALASLDSNGDGVIDAQDEAFSKLSIWIDADNDGVTDEGELSSLSDQNVASISLATDTSGGSEDGQTIFSEGTFIFDDGSTGDFVEVGFDTIAGSGTSDLPVLIGTDADDVIASALGATMMTGGAGADTFVLDTDALSDLSLGDVITDYSSEEGDMLDVSALLEGILGPEISAEEATASVKTSLVDGNTVVSVGSDADGWNDVAVLENHVSSVRILYNDEHPSVDVNHNS